jgi:arginase
MFTVSSAGGAMLQAKRIRIIGVPIDLGARLRGANMGPSALRVAEIGPKLRELGHEVEDAGNIHVAVREAVKKPDPRSKTKYLREIVSAAVELKREVYQSARDARIPLVLGGDHSLAMGSVAGVAKNHGARKERIGLIWLDAHGDINTPKTTTMGQLHAQPVAHILGMGHRALLALGDRVPMVEPSHAVLVGVRDLDPGERVTLRERGIRVFTMREIDEMGMAAVTREAIRIATSGTAGFHLSFDVDVMDPQYAPGVGTPAPGGVTYREGRLAMEILHDSGKMLSMDVVEVNSALDVSNRTAQLAVEMTLTAFGKRIL